MLVDVSLRRGDSLFRFLHLGPSYRTDGLQYRSLNYKLSTRARWACLDRTDVLRPMKNKIEQLIEELKVWAKSKEILEILLEVYSDNEPAIKAYEKSGFKKHMVEMKLHID